MSTLAERVERDCERSGVPVKVTDPELIRRLATIAHHAAKDAA